MPQIRVIPEGSPAPAALAWLVYFDAGFVSAGSKTGSLYVRAVRGGL